MSILCTSTVKGCVKEQLSIELWIHTVNAVSNILKGVLREDGPHSIP